MNIPREFITLLLAKIDVVDLIHTYVPLRKKSGANYFARCPFHQEKSASFSVSQPKQFYYCFGCGASGNAIDFLMQHERLSFKEAVESLAQQAGMALPKQITDFKKEAIPPDLYDFMKVVADDYYAALKQSTRAIDYLKKRGVSGKIAKLFQLGYAPSGWSHLVDTLGKTESDKKKLLDMGLIIQKEESTRYYDRFRDRLMFPIQDYRGRVIGFGGRILDQGEPKYLNSPDTSLFQKGHELYGLHQALQANRKLDVLLVVEGYMDVVMLFQQGITCAVATLGTATTPHHLKRLMRYTAHIIFCFDGDQAGRTAAWRALEVLFPLMQDNLQIKFLFLPDGEDPDSLVQKEGKAAFEKRLQSATSLSAFFFQTLSEQCDLVSMEGRARFAASALHYIKQVSAELLAEILVEELAKRARIDVMKLKQQIKKRTPITPDQLTVSETPVAAKPTRLKPIMHTALALLVQEPHLAKLITEPLPDRNIVGHAFFKELIYFIQTNPDITTLQLTDAWRGKKEERFLASLVVFEHHLPEKGLIHEFRGILKQLELIEMEEAINLLMAKAAQEGLSDREKQQLSERIAKKKTILTTA